MNTRKVTIIVPVYNAEKTIERCVRSIQNQTYKNIEIILVNDGSTDDSLSLCYELQKQSDNILVIDKENSTDSNIVLKLSNSSRPRSWEQYCKKIKGKASYYFEETFDKITFSRFSNEPFLSEFKDKEDVEAFAAFSKLVKLRKEWIGDWQPNWEEDTRKYVICKYINKVSTSTALNAAYCLSFPTEEMRDEFLDCFKDLLESAKSLL